MLHTCTDQFIWIYMCLYLHMFYILNTVHMCYIIGILCYQFKTIHD